MSIPDYIKPGAFVKLFSGTKARIYATDGKAPSPIHGAYEREGGEWGEGTWSRCRRFLASGQPCGLDIAGPWIDKPEVDWKNLPEWAEYAAVDAEGLWWWFQEKPLAVDVAGAWGSPMGRLYGQIPHEYAPFWKEINTLDWRESLVERPAYEDEEDEY